MIYTCNGPVSRSRAVAWLRRPATNTLHLIYVKAQLICRTGFRGGTGTRTDRFARVEWFSRITPGLLDFFNDRWLNSKNSPPPPSSWNGFGGECTRKERQTVRTMVMLAAIINRFVIVSIDHESSSIGRYIEFGIIGIIGIHQYTRFDFLFSLLSCLSFFRFDELLNISIFLGIGRRLCFVYRSNHRFITKLSKTLIT